MNKKERKAARLLAKQAKKLRDGRPPSSEAPAAPAPPPAPAPAPVPAPAPATVPMTTGKAKNDKQATSEPKPVIRYLYRSVDIMPKPGDKDQTVRVQKVPFACLAAIDRYRISWSTCHPKDQWNKKVARHKAVGRARGASSLEGCLLSQMDCIWKATASKKKDGQTVNVKMPAPGDRMMVATELMNLFKYMDELTKRQQANAEKKKAA